ncbi:hypothetical protein GCM10022237_48350 [Nocardioides ginsengisoli]|uniref:Trypsin-like serine peptidase n=1 Tax=Nocardioides ginsengisoli TaxID=363868 RepID=A0ABW3W1T9_9ACTN
MPTTHRRGVAALAWLLLAGLLAATPTTATAVAQGPVATDPGAYWTPQRMRDAQPLDLAGDAPGAGRSTTRAGGSTPVVPPKSVGRLFFSDATSDYSCSAAAVNTPERNVVITAGHCVNTGASRVLLGGCRAGRYFTNFAFVPAYDHADRPYGVWAGVRAVAQAQWITECDDTVHDQAVIAVAPHNGHNLVDVVGGNGLAWNYPAREDGVRVVGWPAEAPYDGEGAQQCAGPTTPSFDSTDAQIACPMNGGASGGPWFVSMVNRDVGFIWAVTSRRTTSGPPTLLAQPFDASIVQLLASLRTAARPVAGRAQASGRPLRITASESVAGRGQGYTLRVRAKAGSRVVVQVRSTPGGRWRQLTAVRLPASGVAYLARPSVRVGPVWYRLHQGKRNSRKVGVTVRPCPLPLDRRAAAVARCSSPSA